MLNVEGLALDIKAVFDDTMPGAFEQAFLSMFPEKTKDGDEKAKEFGKTICNLLSESWAKGIAGAIDYYIKAGSIHGTIITAGSPFTQTAVIAPINLGNPTAGAVPNTLGII